MGTIKKPIFVLCITKVLLMGTVFSANKSEHDTVKIKSLLATTEVVYRAYPDSAIKLSNQALQIINKRVLKAKGKEKRRLKKFEEQALGNLATVHHERGEMEKVIPLYGAIFIIQKERNDEAGMAATLYSMASVYASQGNIPKALGGHTQALEMYEALGDKHGAALAFYSLGRLYGDVEDTIRQEESYKKAYNLFAATKDDWGIHLMKTALGGIYLKRRQYDTAYVYFKYCLNGYSKALMPDGSLGDKWGIANSLECVGRVFDKKNQLDSALVYYLRAMKIREQTQYKIGMALSYAEVGEVYYKQKKINQALEYARKALQVSRELGFPQQISKSAKLLSDLENETGNYKHALEMYKLFYEMTDSLRSEANKKASFKQQLSYEYDKKTALDKERQNRKDEINRKENERKNTILWAVAGGLLLVLVFAVFLFNRFRITNKQKRIIEEQQAETEKQKAIIEEKNKDITDSINYARNIQHAILPPPSAVQQIFKDSFILFKPRDIVSGDFYFLEKINDTVIFAAADCTGHGVPGALVSVVCANALSRVIKEFEITDPGEILNKTREIIIETFERGEKQINDGMDISLCSIEFRISNSGLTDNSKFEIGNGATTLRWAGANNVLWYIQNNQLTEIAGDKQPIGEFSHKFPFKTHTVQLHAGDQLYIFTDGYADQFGGDKGKKFKSSNLKNLISSISVLPMQQQKERLNQAFEEWRGTLEQIDDVCIIGIRF